MLRKKEAAKCQLVFIKVLMCVWSQKRFFLSIIHTYTVHNSSKDMSIFSLSPIRLSEKEYNQTGAHRETGGGRESMKGANI